MINNMNFLLKDIPNIITSKTIMAISENILYSNKFNLKIDEEDIKLFLTMLKTNGNIILNNRDFITKNKYSFKIEKQTDDKRKKNKYILKQFIILFTYIFVNHTTNLQENKNFEKEYISVFNNIYDLLDKLFLCEFFDLYETLELYRYNLVISLRNIVKDKSFIFNESIKYLVRFFNNNRNKQNFFLQPMIKIFDSIREIIDNNQQILFFLRHNKSLYNSVILKILYISSSNKTHERIKEPIIKILESIFTLNCSKVFIEALLHNIKECFYELKPKYELDKILQKVRYLAGQNDFLLKIINNEEDQVEDNFMPYNYFVFDGSKNCGINYNSNLNLLKKSFTIIFSFKSNEMEKDILYPLLTFVKENEKNEISFNISIKNKSIYFLYQNEKAMKKIFDIDKNTSYLIVIEYNRTSFGHNDKINITINGAEINESVKKDIFYPKCRTSLKIGYIPDNVLNKNPLLFPMKNLNGIIGPIIYLHNIIEEKDFITNLFRLKGRYENILYLNPDINLKNYFRYESEDFFDMNYGIAQEYFMKICKKIDEEYLFTISPLSILNKVENKTNKFEENIFSKPVKEKHLKRNKYFETLEEPKENTGATYALINRKTIKFFVQYDGFYIITLQLEFFYNILKMFYNASNEEKILLAEVINNALCPIMSLITKIIIFFKNDNFINELDTFGFSLMKVLNLLADIQPLNQNLFDSTKKSFKLLVEYYKRNEHKKTTYVLLGFINKLVNLLSHPKFYNMRYYSNMESLFNLFGIILKNNPFLICTDILNYFLQFSFLLNPKELDEYNNANSQTDNQNTKYKKMKKEYKTLIGTFIKQCNKIKLYIYFIQKIFNDNISITTKYKLIKIFYEYHELQLIYDVNFKPDKKNDQENNLRSSFFGLFKKDKDNSQKKEFTQEDLLLEYNNQLTKLINSKKKQNKKEEKLTELIKCIFIQLIYEYHVIIPSNLSKSKLMDSSVKDEQFGNSSNTNINSNNSTGSDDENDTIYFFSEATLDKKITEKNLRQSNITKKRNSINENKSEVKEDVALDFKVNKNRTESDDFYLDTLLENKDDIRENKKTKDKYIYIFDILLDSKNISFYIIKGVFACLCDQLTKKKKISFIKIDNNNYDNIDMCFIEFNKFKKDLLFQFIEFLKCIETELLLTNSLKLMFHFINYCMNVYKKDKENLNSKNLLLRLFESKLLMYNLFDYTINNDVIIQKNTKDFFANEIININKHALCFHPKPFVFSFFKNSIKNINSTIILLFVKMVDYIKDTLQKGNFPTELADSSLNCFLYYNEIKFIKVLVEIFRNNPTDSKMILYEDNFKLFNSITKLISEIANNEMIYDSKIYFYNLSSFYGKILPPKKKELFDLTQKNPSSPKKVKERKISVILKDNDTKLLINQVNFINVIELALNSIYLIWTLNLNFLNPKLVSLKYQYSKELIIKINEIFCINGHFLSYYIDFLNPLLVFNSQKNFENLKSKIPEKINSNVNDDIALKNKFCTKGNPSVRENRLVSIILYLIIMKYQSMLIFFETEEKSKKVDEIKSMFSSILNCVQNDILLIISMCSKIKDDKKLKEVMNEREELKSKLFQDFSKSYYKSLIEILFNNKIKNINFENIRNEIELKFLKEEEDQKKEKEAENKRRSTQIPILESVKHRKSSFFNIQKKITKKIRHSHRSSTEFSMYSYNKIKKKIESKNNNFLICIDFKEASNPILCTKRDLVLKRFGSYFYKDYFNDKKFSKMKKYFLYLYPSENIENSYYNCEKLMIKNYPTTLKNYSNFLYYYPRLFLKPNKKFFSDKRFLISHNYCKKEFVEEDDNETFHLEHGHGFLNQNNFNLFFKENDKKNIKKLEEKEKSNEEKNKISDSLYEDRTEDNFYLNKNNTSNKSLGSNGSNINRKNSLDGDEVILIFECEIIKNKYISQGKIKIDKNYIIYQTNMNFDIKSYETNQKYIIASFTYDLEQFEKQILIQYNQIKQIILRKFLYFNQAVEIFLVSGKSYLFNLYDEQSRNDFIEKIKIAILAFKNSKCEIITDQQEYFQKSKYTNLWLDKKLTTLEYLLIVNKFSNRSYNDLNQYLVMPWIMKDFKDIYNKNSYRNMFYPMAVQNPDVLENVKQTYNLNYQEDGYNNYFNIHYSTSVYVNNYLMRINPFINNQIKVQGNKLEVPERQIESLQDLCNLFQAGGTDNMELIPEIFSMPEIFLNLNYCWFGALNNKTLKKSILINNLKLESCFNSIQEFVTFHQEKLNSNNISSNINKWIDNIFGENQLTDKKNVINSYPKECYEKFMKEIIHEKLDKLNNTDDEKNKKKIIKEIKGELSKINLFGQCPSQLFTKTHPSFSCNKKNDENTVSNIDNCKLYIENDNKKLQNKNILYMNESSDGNYLYLLTNNEILVYTKLLKQVQNLNISFINKITPPFCYIYENQNNKIQNHMYKYLIFDAEDCKYFFIGGYKDNSFHIYSKEKEKDISTKIFTESRITCIKNINGKPLFFTGHLNGKLIKWKMSLNYNKEYKKKGDSLFPLIIERVSEVIAHNNYVKIIENNEKLGIVLTVDGKGIVFLRKTSDFELLNYIDTGLNITNAILFKELIIISSIQNNTMKITSYSLNGIPLGEMYEELLLPISVKMDTGEIFIFGNSKMNLVKTTLKSKTSLLTLDSDSKPKLFESGNEDDKNNSENKMFNQDLVNSDLVAYFYDMKFHVLFCVFSNGQLYRVNIIKNI